MGATKKAGKALKAKAPGRAAGVKATRCDAHAKRIVCEVPRDLAEKKKHVRELAKTGDWEQIKCLYGEKMVAKARAFVNKNGTLTAETEVQVVEQLPPPVATEKMTPQLIAKQILARNGYATKGNRVENPPSVPEETPRVVETSVKAVDSPAKRPLRQTQRQPSLQSPKKAARVAPVGSNDAITDSPETLTEEQKRRIEERRREALQKRKRVVAPATPMVAPRGVHVIPGSVEARQQAPAQSSWVDPRKSVQILPPPRPATYSTPAKLPKRVETSSIEKVMLDELEIAAQITDWDFEPIPSVQPRVVTPPAHNMPQSSERHTSESNQRRQQVDTLKRSSAVLDQGCSRGTPAVSLSQELAAAAEIALWEEEQEHLSRKRSDPSKPSEARRSSVVDQRPISSRQPPNNGRKSTQAPQPKPIPHQQRQTTAATKKEDDAKKLENFIAKNFLEDKLDTAVLDFVNMMLA